MDETPIVPLPLIKITPPFPQRLKKKDDDTKFKKFLAKFSNLTVNIPLLEALQEMSGYAKFMKDLVTKKRFMDFETIEVTHNCSAIMSSTVVVKKEDPGLGAPKTTTIRLLIADHSIKKPVDVLYDVLVKVDQFIFLADFVILDYEIDHEVPIILGRPFLATERALVDVECGEIKFRVNNKEVSFNVCKSMKQPMDLQVISVIDVVDDEMANTIEMYLMNDPLVGVLWNFGSEVVEEYDEVVASLIGLGSYTKNPIKLDLDLKNRESPPAKPSIIEPPQLKHKLLPSHLKYIFLGEDNTFPIILAGDLEPYQVDALKSIMKKFIRAIRWTIANIIGISSGICSYKIKLILIMFLVWNTNDD
ncbi:uncharacterized protein LOC107871936 [Capsicum annuum]|uniref:uncharacterized protein LOC107871936 n=1 Tax=Capsicum annuum TaxID=4072 RepID=UPI001FB0EB82|nr:uncharacterized protein LOC107871936 [Capsicum annuum]